MIVRLRKSEDGCLAGQWSLGSEVKIFTVGRATDSDVHVPHFSVSRHHAVISKEDETGKIWYEDLSSANGSFYQGKMITSKMEFKPGTEIMLADSGKFITLTFKDNSDYKSAQKRLFEESGMKAARFIDDENVDPMITTAKKKLFTKPDEKESPKTKQRGFNIDALENKFRLFEKLQAQQLSASKVSRPEVTGSLVRERSRSKER